MKDRGRSNGVPLFVRIAAGYGVVLLVMLGVTALTLLRLQQVTAVADRLSRRDAPALQAIDDLRLQLSDQQLAVSRFVLSGISTPGGREDLLQPFFRADDVIFGDLAALDQFEAGAGQAGLASALSRLRGEIEAVETVSNGEIAAVRAGTQPHADVAGVAAQADSARSMAAAIGDQVGLQIRVSAVDAQQSASDSARLVLGASVLGLTFSVVVAIIVTLNISAPLRRLTATANRIAAGEMVEPAPSRRRDEIGSLSRAVTEMVRTLNQQAGELRQLADADELTGLVNRRGFMMLAEHQLRLADRQQTSLSLVFLDVDQFKSINDQFGHDEGDRALRELAGLLLATFRKSDVVARLGGDEFCILMADIDPSGLETVLRRCREGVAAFNRESRFPWRLSVSLGLATYDAAHPEPLEALIASADRAMYRDKEQSRAAA